ncbi:hypothetical protein TNCT_432541 [Trichonephila clavata]|uniref:Uncharacterized protein n=1 Tax=Trichonephila clavata TaxID=2740835 RepID=A0A8X6K915_TRICU|nr:hypothetical protein TNCT_432541 [Trichonephila clavata]
MALVKQSTISKRQEIIEIYFIQHIANVYGFEQWENGPVPIKANLERWHFLFIEVFDVNKIAISCRLVTLNFQRKECSNRIIMKKDRENE